MQRILKTLFLMVFLPAAVYAGGGKQIVTQTADGIDIWQTEFDVSEKKKGTWNIIITARDAAGNEGISGPFNLKVDPMAGLPEARVVYPEHRQVVREDVNIVGVASARYGVKQIFVKIDDGEYQELEGNEYWSLFIPALDLVEGKHTIYVKSIDSMDIEGPVSRTDFILDLVPPEIELVDREIGDLIAGSVKIKGKVSDLNGVQSVLVSNDGETFTKMSLSKKRGDDARYFQFPISSKKYSDGPIVYYIRAVNQTGSSITRPFLFFVNNYPPQIEIISPKRGEDIYGKTQVTGMVTTGVGLTDFYYEWAGERHEIPLRPGDPFWSVTFPISMANNRAIPFRVTAIDKSGNVTTVAERFQDLRKNRAPVIAIDFPPQPGGLSRMNLEPGQPIYGHILPGFFPYAIMIEGEIEYVMAQPVFRIDPELIPEGRNTMRLWAIDEDDVTGPPFTLRINKAPRTPDFVPLAESTVTITSPEEYAWFSESVTIRGSLDGFRSGHSLEYRLSWDENWRPITVNNTGSFSAVISLTDLPEGPVPMEFRTVRDGQGDYPLFFPVNKYTTLPVLNFMVPDEQYGFIHGDVTTAGTVDYVVPLTQISYSVDNGVTFEELEFSAKYNKSWFNSNFDYSALQNNRQKLIIRAVDRAGNRVQASPNIVFDNSNDFPELILNTPLDGDIISNDFNVSGLAFDDDGLAAVYWRILTPRNPWDTIEETTTRHRNTEFNRFETEQNFLMPISIYDVTDGENILEIFASDMYGVQCETIRRVFKVSTAPPVSVVTAPSMDIWNRGNIVVRGTSFDLNGIDDILISMDNGVSYQKANFTSSQRDPAPWNINLNTKAYTDGIYSMLVRTIDKYGISSFASGIINIDNTPPEIDLGSPRNGDRIGVTLNLTGQVYDNIEFTRLAVQLVNVENPNVQRSFDLPKQFVIMEAIDVTAFPDGDYTVKIVAYDQSGNETSLIRNFNILKARAASEVAIINPLPGISHHGPLIVSGKITGAVIPEKVTLMLDNKDYALIDVNRYGIFRYELPDDAIETEDPVVFSAYFRTPGGERIVSFENKVRVYDYGPMLVVDSHNDGDVITRRPYISGRAFFTPPPSPDDAEAVEEEGDGELEAEEAPVIKLSSKEQKAKAKLNPQVRKVEISFDNGRSFVSANGTDQWKYRLETGELERGTLPLVIKASFTDNSVAIRRILLVVDTRPPVVNTIGPPENSSHRTEVAVYGSSSDDYDMDSIQISLRPGDKNLYAVPGFIQGLYLDGNALGGYVFGFGIGLTFFDDNVKLQFQAAQASPGTRYSGWAFGGKVLANVFTKKLGDWFGPDWEFWTTSITVGAHFAYFWGMKQEGEKPLWMGQLIGQWEIIKANMGFFFPKWKYFKSFSIYTEPGLWFAPSDVVSEQAWRTKFTIGFGGRISLF
jgi:hypothetical protein